MAGPSGDRLIRVDMTKLEATTEIVDFPDDWKLLGGRALSARILLEECDATGCDPARARQRAGDGAGRALGTAWPPPPAASPSVARAR